MKTASKYKLENVDSFYTCWMLSQFLNNVVRSVRHLVLGDGMICTILIFNPEQHMAHYAPH